MPFPNSLTAYVRLALCPFNVNDATQDSAADVFGVLTNGVDNNLVRMTSILKFGMSDDVGPGDIQSVDYTVTLGDVTLSTQ